eukprot:gnl/MRDRNA2_/MRDRNA2_69493_c0_seq1.p1 gnl/MRDRNA2_/MRDRNA2_69493_c0~~gnl/MRDRNA2_/MRDRNA2_69493_c0_seq1.p1  ORF type:complete len:103 (-),score=20.48 gnl/MRDRNA2_/MRDRNA2_69493_c0_seq1:485-793(-)
MSENCIGADCVGSSAAMIVFQKAQQWQSCLALLIAMLRWKLQPDTIAKNVGINACEKEGLWQCSLHLLGSMSEEGLEASHVTCTAALGSFHEDIEMHHWAYV